MHSVAEGRWGRHGVWAAVRLGARDFHRIPRPVDKGVHKAVDSLGRLVGFWLRGGGGWGCRGDRLGLRLGDR